MNMTAAQTQKLTHIKTLYGDQLESFAITKNGLLFVRIKYKYSKILAYMESYFGPNGEWVEINYYRKDDNSSHYKNSK